MTQEICLLCDKPAEWIRSTQFAGNHPFCDNHARQEEGFGISDSYEYWYAVDSKKESTNE